MYILTTLLAIASALVRSTDGGNACETPENHPHPVECCNIPGIMPHMTTTRDVSFEKCTGKIPVDEMLKRSPPQNGIINLAQNLHNRMSIACVDQCIFHELGLFGLFGSLNKARVKSLFMMNINYGVASIVDSSIDSCIDSYKVGSDNQQICKTGATEFVACHMRNVFLNCPQSKWVNSDRCQKLKNIVQQCPSLQPILIKH